MERCTRPGRLIIDPATTGSGTVRRRPVPNVREGGRKHPYDHRWIKQVYWSLQLVLAVACVTAPATASANPLTMWLASSMDRVGRNAPAGKQTAIKLFAAKRQSVSFQVIVQAPPAGLTGVRISMTDLVSESGARMPVGYGRAIPRALRVRQQVQP